MGEWEALRKFGAERKSPIGYKPFALACMRKKQTVLLDDDTERYITGYIERVSVARSCWVRRTLKRGYDGGRVQTDLGGGAKRSGTVAAPATLRA